MKKFNFILEPYKGSNTRYRCPNCQKKRNFTRYINCNTNEYVNELVGKCNSITSCGYHYTPKQYRNENNISFDTSSHSNFKTIVKPKPATSYINVEVVVKSINTEKPNYFIEYLSNHWDKETAYFLANKYKIGTSKHWNGATVFWQTDMNNRVRTGKIMLYNQTTGKRVKEPYNHINWVHSAMKLDNFNLEQCYFGEHLLNENKNKPIAIVESEKTAIIASVYLPEFIWLACGSATNLNKAKTKALKGRNVFLFPDLGCYDLWNNKIPQLTKLATFKTSTLLKDKASEYERKQGLDIADYLIKIK